GGCGGPAVAIFAVALAVRLVHLWQIRRAPFFTVLLGDSRAYDEWAQRLAGGDWIGHEVFYQAPLYPYFLGLLYAIGGRHLLLVRVVQAFVGSAACVLLSLAARRLFSVRAGLAAGLSLTRENAIVFTAVIAVWSFWHSRRAAAAFLAGVAIVIVPVAIRNSTVGGGFYVTTSQFGPNFYIGNNPQSDGSYQPLRFGRGAPEDEREA